MKLLTKIIVIIILLCFVIVKPTFAEGGSGGVGTGSTVHGAFFDSGGTQTAMNAAMNNAYQVSHLDPHTGLPPVGNAGVTDAHAFDNFLYSLANPDVVHLGPHDNSNLNFTGHNPIVDPKTGKVSYDVTTYTGSRTVSVNHYANGEISVSVGCNNGKNFSSYKFDTGISSETSSSTRTNSSPNAPKYGKPNNPNPGQKQKPNQQLNTKTDSSQTSGSTTKSTQYSQTSSTPPSNVTVPSSYDGMTCSCAGVVANDLLLGQKGLITAYGNVDHDNEKTASISSFDFSLNGDTQNLPTAMQTSIHAIFDGPTDDGTRYKATWSIDLPADLKKGIVYKISAKPVCAQKSAYVPTSNKQVMGESTIHIGTFEPSSTIEKSCDFIRIKF